MIPQTYFGHPCSPVKGCPVAFTVDGRHKGLYIVSTETGLDLLGKHTGVFTSFDIADPKRRMEAAKAHAREFGRAAWHHGGFNVTTVYWRTSSGILRSKKFPRTEVHYAPTSRLTYAPKEASYAH